MPKKPEKYGKSGYTRGKRVGSAKSTWPKKTKKTVSIVKKSPVSNSESLPRNTIKEIENFKKQYVSVNIDSVISLIEKWAKITKESDNLDIRNHFTKLLVQIGLDKKADKIIRLKALEQLLDLNVELYFKLREKILRNLEEKIEFKIDSIKIVDKSVKVYSQGNAYVIGNNSMVNISDTKRKFDNFIDPNYCQHPTTLLITAEEINALYKDGYTKSLFGVTRTLVENYLLEVIAKVYPGNSNLWRTGNSTLMMSRLIDNLFRDPNILVNANTRPYAGNISEIKDNLNEIARRCNNAMHNAIPITDGQVEELKDYVNRVIPYLYKLIN